MSWHPICDQADIQDLMSKFGGFHDGCVREAHMWTQSWVNDDLAMAVAANLDTRFRLWIQRQFRDPSAIELLFEEVVTIHWVPTADNYDSIIFGASLVIEDNLIYWSPDYQWTPNQPERDKFTWIAAKKLSWREVGWLGEELHYGPKPNELGKD